MGSVFSFVSSDLKQKIDILQELLEKDQDNYQTIKTMIQYEKDNNLLEKKDFVSGARTFLRLHRGLGNFPISINKCNLVLLALKWKDLKLYLLKLILKWNIIKFCIIKCVFVNY